MKLHFNFADIFKGPRIAFSFQRVWIQFSGLLVGYLLYFGFTYAALLIHGYSLAQSWLIYRVFPFFPINSASMTGWFVYGTGIILALIVHLLTATAVSRSAYMLLKGNYFYTWREAWRFAIRKKWSLLFAQIAPALLIACFFIAGWLLALVGMLPGIGMLVFSLIFLLLVLCALLLLFLLILFAGTILMAPAILATTDEDAFEVVFQTIALIWHQPWRLIGSQVLNSGTSLFSLLVFAFFTKKAILLIISIYQFPLVVAKSFRDNFLNIMNQAFALLQEWLLNLSLLLDTFFGEASITLKAGVFLHNYFPLLKKSMIGPELHFAAVVIAISLLLTGGAVLAFGLATFNSGCTFIYISLRYHKEKVNLLERKDHEEENKHDQKKSGAE